MDHLLGFISPREVVLGAALFVVAFAVSLAIISIILIKLPPTYFQQSHNRDFWIDRHPSIRWAGLIVKNTLGALLVLLGVVMAIPGVPGQGILTILLGILLLDLPGKRRLEHKLISRPMVLEKINSLRHRFSKPPLMLD
jgi:hypothetical protein